MNVMSSRVLPNWILSLSYQAMYSIPSVVVLFLFLLTVLPTYDVQANNTPMVVNSSQAKSVDSFIKKHSDTRIIIVGETHDSVSDHMLQLNLLKAMHKQGGQVVVGVEWFQRPFQNVLDSYINDEIDENNLLAKSEYYTRWGFDFRLYRPILSYAKKHKIPVIALNARRELTEAIMRNGITGIPQMLKKDLPASYDMNNERYNSRLLSIIGDPDNDKTHEDAQTRNYMEVQMIWDEYMSETISDYIKNHSNSRMIVFTGRGHINADAIPGRIHRRIGIQPVTIVNYQPASSFNDADYLVLSEDEQLPPYGKMGVKVSVREDGVYVDELLIEGLVSIQKNDRILAIGDRPVISYADLKLSLIDKYPGDKVSLLLLRSSDNAETTIRTEITLVDDYTTK